MANTFLFNPADGAYDIYTSAQDYGRRCLPPAPVEARAVMTHLQETGVFAAGSNILDLGCGPGFLLEQAATISPNPATPHFGLDKSHIMVTHATHYLQPSNIGGQPNNTDVPRVRVADIRNMQQLRTILRPPGSAPGTTPYQFDVIACLNVLSHIDPATHETLIQYWREFLKPGGHILVQRGYYADVSRGCVLGTGQTYTRATIPGSVLFVRRVGPNAALPTQAHRVVQIAEAPTQRSSERQLQRLLRSVARSWGYTGNAATERVRPINISLAPTTIDAAEFRNIARMALAVDCPFMVLRDLVGLSGGISVAGHRD